MDKKETPYNRKRLFTIAAVLLIAAAILIFGSSAPLPEGTLLCGLDASGMCPGQAEKHLTEAVQTYTARVQVGDQSFQLTAADVGLVVLHQQFRDVVRSCDAAGTDPDPWSLMTLDLDKLASHLATHFDEQRIPAVPPVVAFDEAENSFRAIAGQPESWYSRELLADHLLEGIGTLSPVIEIPEADLLLQQQDKQLEASAEVLAGRANQLMTQSLTYEFRPRQYPLGTEVLDSATIASFLRFDVENERIYADTESISTYVDYIAPKYPYTKMKDRFLAHDGGRLNLEIAVQPQSVNKAALVSLIAETVTAGASGSFEVPYSGARNFEGTYVEVSIPLQHLWVYQNDVCVLDSPVVTGFEGIGRFTPVGLNYVRGHLRNIELFADSFVEYCMSFTTGGQYCFHDADHWREPQEYGGITYQSHGSGGCVNVPVWNMAHMYELVEDGTPVLIHHYYHYDRYSFPN